MLLSTVTYRDARGSSKEFRIDPEFFKPSHIALAEKLELAMPCSEYIEYLTDGTHQTPQYKSHGIPFLSSGNIHQCEIHFNNTKYISIEEHNRLKHCQPQHKDILISKSGRIGHAAVVPKEYKKGDFNIYEGVALLRVKDCCPYAIALMFNSNILQQQIRRVQKGVAQPHLHLEDIRNLKIPAFSCGLIEKLGDAYKNIESLSRLSQYRYSEAQKTLLSNLNLINWEPKHQLSFVKSFSDTKNSERFDAEYYQPKFDSLINAVKNNSSYYKRVIDIKTYNRRGLQPIYSEDGALDVITSKNILEDGLDFEKFSKTSSSQWDLQKQARLYKGDILTYTTGANIGRTAFYSSGSRALASNHVNVLRVKDENPEYVGFVMNSLIGRLQTEKMSAGSAQAELYPKDIDSFIIPFVDKPSENSIIEKVNESKDLREESKHLLRLAKKAIEVAIDKNEKSAIKMLDGAINEMQI
jgi:restriction endonuclease S subunit